MIVSAKFTRFLNLWFAFLLVLSVGDCLAAEESEPTLVTVTHVTSTSVAPTVPAAGTVFSRNETQITAGMAGRLMHLAEPGDYVEAGTPVAVFDCDMLELQRERQLAEADRARINAATLSREVERLVRLRMDEKRIRVFQLLIPLRRGQLVDSAVQIAELFT